MSRAWRTQELYQPAVGYEAPIAAFTERFGAKLAKHDLPPQIVFHAVQLATERDCVYLPLVGRPQASISKRWVENFQKTLYQAGLTRAQADAVFDKEDVEYVVDTWLYRLTPRPGFEEMLQIYKDAGIEFYAASNAVPERIRAYFDKAKIPMADDRIADFTSVGVSKPEREPYRYLWDHYGAVDETVIFQGASRVCSRGVATHSQRLIRGTSLEQSRRASRRRTAPCTSTRRVKRYGESRMCRRMTCRRSRGLWSPSGPRGRTSRRALGTGRVHYGR